MGCEQMRVRVSRARTDGCRPWEFRSPSLPPTSSNKNLLFPAPSLKQHARVFTSVFTVTLNLCRREEQRQRQKRSRFKNGFQLETVRHSGGQRDVLTAPGAAGAPQCRFIVRWAVIPRLGNRVGAKEKSRGAGSELLAGGVVSGRMCRVFLLRGRQRDGERGGRGAGRTQRGGPEPLSLQESMSVLLKPSIQKTHTLYLLFSFPFGLFVNLKKNKKMPSVAAKGRFT